MFKNVSGDFIAVAKVADYPGRRFGIGGDILGNNEGSLMVRVPNPDNNPDQEKLIANSMFLAWGIGNLWTSFEAGRSRPQEGNKTGNNANAYLMIERVGEEFFLRTSPDGKQWFDMPKQPIVRPDMKSPETLQLGFAHASYGDLSSWIEFDGLSIYQAK